MSQTQKQKVEEAAQELKKINNDLTKVEEGISGLHEMKEMTDLDKKLDA